MYRRVRDCGLLSAEPYLYWVWFIFGIDGGINEVLVQSGSLWRSIVGGAVWRGRVALTLTLTLALALTLTLTLAPALTLALALA